jgi:hypothetical protein
LEDGRRFEVAFDRSQLAAGNGSKPSPQRLEKRVKTKK